MKYSKDFLKACSSLLRYIKKKREDTILAMRKKTIKTIE